MKYKYVAIDFDGTIAGGEFPEIGELLPGAKETITRLYEEGHRIMINTCRCGIYQQQAEQFLIENGVPFHTVNENHPELVEFFGNDTRKLGADVYIDDKNIYARGKVDWADVHEFFFGKEHTQ